MGAGAGYGSLVGDSFVEILDFWQYYTPIKREAGYFTATAGFDYQFLGSFVVGGFVEYDASNYADPTLEQTSLGGRLGFLPFDRVLIFASAGYSTMDIADQDVTSLGYDLPVDGKVEFPTASGTFIGIGAEIMFTRSLSLRGEYRHAFFDKQVLALPDMYFIDLDSVATADFKPESEIFRLTLSYKIGLGN